MLARVRNLLSCLVVLIAFAAAPAGALTIELIPADSIVSPSDVVFLDVVASGVDPDVLGDFDVDISFDPILLTLAGFSLGGSLGDFSLLQALDFSLGEGPAGLLNIAVVSVLPEATLDALQGASFVLATIELMVGSIAPGEATQIALAINAIGNGAGDPLPVEALGSASLRSVPEPGTLGFVAVGLLALACRPARRTAV